MDGLSTNATRLLVALIAEPVAVGEDAPRHVPDRELAERCHIDQRHVIDAAAELLAAGYLCLADGAGRWLGTLAEARVYRDGLHQRGKRVLHRLTLVNNAIARHAAGTSPDDRGQLALFAEAKS